MRLIDADNFYIPKGFFNDGINVPKMFKLLKMQSTIDPATLAPRWVSVEERLPEQRDAYLVATEDGDVYDAEFIPSVKQWWIDDDLRLDVTHWQPLPEPPKEGENNA